MYGKNAPNFEGYFQIKCNNGTNECSLIGSPGGSLIWNGIEIGKTETTNISNAPLGESDILFKKRNGICIVFFTGTFTNLPASQYTSVTAKIPVGFRPIAGVNLYPQSTGALKISILLNPNGTITGWNYSGTTSERKSNFLNEAMYFASDS